MRIASILDFLKDDIELTNALEHKRSHPKITAYTAHDKNVYPYVTVKLTPFLADTFIEQYECEIRVVTDDKLSIEKLTDLVINRLHFGNQPAVEQGSHLIQSSSHNGGTLNVDEEKGIYEQVLFFNIKFKRKR